MTVFEKYTHKVNVYRANGEYLRFFYADSKEHADIIKLDLDWAFNKHSNLRYILKIVSREQEAIDKQKIKNLEGKIKLEQEKNILLKKLAELDKEIDSKAAVKAIKESKIEMAPKYKDEDIVRTLDKKLAKLLNSKTA